MNIISKTAFKNSLLTIGSVALSFTPAYSADDPEVTVSADLVSNYIWRGSDLGGVSVQPTLGVAYAGFSLSAWGSIGFDQIDPKEIDLMFSYSYGGFCIGITDYWVAGTRSFFHFDPHDTGHVFEGNIGYDFGILALSWNTVFAGADYYRKEDTKRAYSSYFQISAPFSLGGLEWSAEVGGTPWKGAYAEEFAIINVGLGASKDIEITDRFTLPVSAKVIANPSTESLYLVFGVTF